MTRRYFGTDGIRGTANEPPMTADFALRFAYACARVLGCGHRASVVIGKDTRLSGYMLEQALTAGFVACGVDVKLLGPIPTPAVAYLTQHLKADFGVVISASHNPYRDNGIKLIGPDGYKLSDEIELRIEAALDMDAPLVSGEKLGKASRVDDALALYEQSIVQGLHESDTLAGLKIVIDAANGAAYRAAPHLFKQLGADIVAMFCTPDGMNINEDCGATHTHNLCKEVVAQKADLGVALDGDADRVILVDETGAVIDGDQILAVLAQDQEEGQAVVSTHMANLALERYLKTQGRDLVRANVGDRYVVEAMRENNLGLGGEPSGHVLFGGARAGDGLRTALHMALHLKKDSGKASATLRRFNPLPQILQNVRAPKSVLAALDADIKDAEEALAGMGRLLVRASGTEPLIRVMAEGDDAAFIAQIVQNLCVRIEKLAAAQAA